MNHIDTTATGWLKATCYPIVAVIIGGITSLGIDPQVILIYSALMAIDTVSGWIKVAVLPITFKSYEAIRGILSKLAMLLLILAVALVAKAVGAKANMLISVGTSLLCVAEGFSISGHVYSIRTGREVEEWDAVTFAIVAIRKKLKKILEALAKD